MAARISRTGLAACALVPAAGEGTRAGRLRGKLLEPVAGAPVLAWVLAALQRTDVIQHVTLVCRPEHSQEVLDLASRYGCTKVGTVVEGGETRADSVRLGLRSIPQRFDIVAIHDGARPFVTPELIERSVELASQFGAAVAAIPLTDTIKEVGDDCWVVRTPERQRLWAAQTPQTFRRQLIFEAYQAAIGVALTDDAAAVERLGHPVKLFMGSVENIKITTPVDFRVAEHIARSSGRRPPGEP